MRPSRNVTYSETLCARRSFAIVGFYGTAGGTDGIKICTHSPERPSDASNLLTRKLAPPKPPVNLRRSWDHSLVWVQKGFVGVLGCPNAGAGFDLAGNPAFILGAPPGQALRLPVWRLVYAN